MIPMNTNNRFLLLLVFLSLSLVMGVEGLFGESTNSASAPTSAAAPSTAAAATPTPDPEHPVSSVPGETKAQRDARMAWWRKAKFGMFVHWGVYSVPAGYYNGQPVQGAGEWIMHNGKIPMAEYQAFAKKFNPQEFDAAKFVAAAKSAGMKYIVITAKHHDGFAMFDSKVNNWTIVRATPYKKDPLKALAEECRKQGMKLGFYYSQAQDWNNGGAVAGGKKWDAAQEHNMDDYIQETAVPQVTELLTNYGPDTPAIIWWDTPGKVMNKERAAKIEEVVQKLRPGIIQNNRMGGRVQGDTKTPEQFVPPGGYPGYDWETCMTLNDTWGFKKDDNNWKSTQTLIRNLCDIASKGGNYLLNVGPDALGNIPEESLKRLAEVGAWMKANGEAIYGTQGTPFGEEFGPMIKSKNARGKEIMISSENKWRATQKEGHIYLIIFEWPSGGSFNAPVIAHKLTGATLLAAPSTKLTVTQGASGTKISGLPVKAPDQNASVIDLQY